MLGNKYVSLSKSAVQADQPLLFPVYNQQGTLLAEKGMTLSETQIKTLITTTEIYTLHRSLRSAVTSGTDRDESEAILRLPPPLKRLSDIEKILHSIYKNPNNGTTLSKILTVINRLQIICMKSPDAAIAKIITDSNENYAVRHALHTAILCELTATHLEWPLERKRNLLGAALTMNISLGFMQDDLLDQPQPLSLEQQKTINEHPTKSVEMLRHIGVQNIHWLELVSKHHETIDGNGYPNGWHRKNIPLGALIISLSDIYCAKVSGRNYREPIYANVATRDIFLEKDHTEKGTLIEIFVKILGLYPPGCFVRLKSNEIGIVVARGERIDTPIVKILSENSSDPFERKIKRHTSDKNYAVKEIIPSKTLNVNIEHDSIWPF